MWKSAHAVYHQVEYFKAGILRTLSSYCPFKENSSGRPAAPFSPFLHQLMNY